MNAFAAQTWLRRPARGLSAVVTPSASPSIDQRADAPPRRRHRRAHAAMLCRRSGVATARGGRSFGMKSVSPRPATRARGAALHQPAKYERVARRGPADGLPSRACAAGALARDPQVELAARWSRRAPRIKPAPGRPTATGTHCCCRKASTAEGTPALRGPGPWGFGSGLPTLQALLDRPARLRHRGEQGRCGGSAGDHQGESARRSPTRARPFPACGEGGNLGRRGSDETCRAD